jgi:hypothetical protein
MIDGLKKTVRNIAISGAVLFGVSAPAQSAVIELALALDGSGSISSSQFLLQKNAYQSIFSNNFYDNYVVGGDTLHVSAWQFASGVVQETAWFEITDNASAALFANQFASIGKLGGSTNITGAINLAHNAMVSNTIVSDRQIIDISTDGQPNNPNNAYQAAANAFAGGTVTNAIGVGSNINTGILDTLTTNGGGFYTTAANFDQFEAALAQKLFREINTPQVSEPATLALFGLGLMGIAAARRRAQS